MYVLTDSTSLHSINYHVYTFWLFVHEQVKDTIVPVPRSLFLVLGLVLCLALIRTVRTPTSCADHLLLHSGYDSLSSCSVSTTNTDRSLWGEDAANKAWQPLPANYLTISQANEVILATYPLRYPINLCAGVICECVMLTCLFSGSLTSAKLTGIAFCETS